MCLSDCQTEDLNNGFQVLRMKFNRFFKSSKVSTIDSLFLKLVLHKGNNNEVLRKWVEKVGCVCVRVFV